MSSEIHMYMAVAQALNAEFYPAGERHPVLVFLRQEPGSEHDFEAAAAVALKEGWTDIDFTKAGTLPPDAGEEMKEPFASCHAAAVKDGDALLVYPTVVKPAPGT